MTTPGDKPLEFSATRRRKWRPRVGVRTLLVIIAALATLLAWDLRRSREIHPPDIIRVDVRSALPGRPIAGKRLVRPGGEISLGYYGNVHVAGLTPREAKAKVVDHLKRHLSDESLGLVETIADAPGRRPSRRSVAARETDRVSVHVETKNATSGFLAWVMRGVCHWYEFGRE